MPTLPVTFSEGLVTSRPREELSTGELQAGTGIWYKPGDTHRAHKIRGRSEFGDTSPASMKGIALCKFDGSGLDRIFAYTGTILYRASAGVTGTFTSFQTGLNSSGANLTAIHYNDTWFLGNGYDRQFAIESDGTTIRMGMLAPSTGPTIATSSAALATVRRPQAHDTLTWTSPGLAYDTDESTYAYAWVNVQNQAFNCTWRGWESNTDANRVLRVTFQMDWQNNTGSYPGTYAKKRATINILYSVNDGATFSTLVSYPDNSGPIGKSTVQVPISVNSDQVRVLVGTSVDRESFHANLKVFDITIMSGATNDNFDMEYGGVIYAITEYDQDHGLESIAAWTESDRVNFTAKNLVTLTLPATAVNTNTTHFRIYRTHDGGSAPRDLRLIDPNVTVGTTTWVDNFDQFDKDTPGGATLNLLKLQTDPDVEADYYESRTAPNAFAHMNAYGPFIVGLSPDFPRALFWSLPDAPHYWPALYVNTRWPLPERDELVSTATVGDSLVVGAREAIIAIDGLPEAIAGEMQSPNVRVMRGQPGVVNVDAMCSFSIAGEPRAAWVSHFGVHITNSQTAQRISDDLDWENTVNASTLSSAVLHWDRERALLIMSYDADGNGLNDSLLFFHMDPRHAKANGMPKITGPHYGKVTCFTSGIVDGTYRLYSGQASNGSVYVENNGTTDDSQAYSGTTVPLIATTGRIYGPDGRAIEVIRGQLFHTDAGDGETVDITCTAYRDADNTSQTRTLTVSLEGHGATAFWVAMSGDSFEFQVVHDGSADFALLKMDLQVRTTGKAGTVRTA